jgi:hypothetical protein
MTISRLKPDPKIADLAALEAKVRALYAAWAERGRKGYGCRDHNREDRTWPELIELCRSIREDAGWLLWVNSRGKLWQLLDLVLPAPGLAVHASQRRVSVEPYLGELPFTMIAEIYDAAKARFAKDRKAVPDYQEHGGCVDAWKAAVAAIRSTPPRNPS